MGRTRILKAYVKITKIVCLWQVLLTTGRRTIIYVNKYDEIAGVSVDESAVFDESNYVGQNIYGEWRLSHFTLSFLGQCLMMLRDELSIE